ncbi:hypothetical protein T10_11758 [Trichinella papuae]|uniref:Uncharacterized protein n=1 Tax=Trichinella papuae TaxID=268474 RepID=A0A0V1N8S7_9BILA|nr:hypothetical protein T10_11758 [Trichinella papuae]
MLRSCSNKLMRKDAHANNNDSHSINANSLLFSVVENTSYTSSCIHSFHLPLVLFCVETIGRSSPGFDFKGTPLDI